jgi:peptide-N4-(N-acetyl-beta-glucosaminyl)asparagine amidase
MAAVAENDQVMDEQFRKRVQQSFATVQAWENEELLRRCRAELVPDAFYNNKKKTEREAVQILAQHFQTKVMTWVNTPSCDACGTTAPVRHETTTNQPRDEHGATCRVEVFRCETCDKSLEFPRYNSIVRLLQSRQGRCGEYANLFGCLCRAVGLETRYILDFTDHGE